MLSDPSVTDPAMLAFVVVLALIQSVCVAAIWRMYEATGQGKWQTLCISAAAFLALATMAIAAVRGDRHWLIWGTLAVIAGYALGVTMTGPGSRARYLDARQRVLGALLASDRLGSDLGSVGRWSGNYVHLAAMEEEDLVQGYEVDSGQRKYRITGHGRAWLLSHPRSVPSSHRTAP